MRALSVALAIVLGLHSATLAAPPRRRASPPGRGRQGARRGDSRADRKALVEILGPKAIRWCGPETTSPDRAAFQRFMAAYDRAHRLEGGGGKVVLYVGDDDFPFPIPLVPDGPRWFWDTEAGTMSFSVAGSGRTSSPRSRCAWPTSTPSANTIREAPGSSSTRSGWRAPRASTTASSGRQPGERPKARSAPGREPRGRRLSASPRGGPRPITATSIASSSRRAPTRPAELRLRHQGHMIGGSRLVASRPPTASRAS